MSISSEYLLDQKVLVEQIKIQHRTLIPILFVNLLVSLALTYGLWDVVSQTNLKVWMGLMVFILVVRVFSYLIYRYKFKPEQAQRYGMYFVIGAGTTGLLWGIGAVVLFPDNGLEYQLFVLFVLVGMGAGAVSSLTTYLPAFLSYFPSSMLPIGVKLLLVGDPIHLSLGVMSLAYIIALTYFGININRTIIQSLRLRFENIDLVEQLRQQKDEAEQANLSKTKFLAAASHDLRQPLHALTLFTSVLNEEIKYPKVRRVVDQINASIEALQSLFNALLDISRLDAGVMKVEKTNFQLQVLFNKLANDFNPQAKEKGLEIFWPDIDEAIYTDASLFEQVLRNYVSNAIRYTSKGEVRISCEANGEQVVVKVSDTGAGIPDEEREAIFDEFHQLSNPERDRSKGLGLGLAIVQRTAKLLGHVIDHESESGKGSTFSITVPQASIVEISASSLPNETDIPKQEKHSLILVIDDEAAIREGTKSLMETWDCQVVTAVDKDEALAKLKKLNQSPDGIIADYRLRENQTGLEAIHAIHTEYGDHIPALIVTGDIAVERLRDVNNSGFQVLHKPVAPLKLRAFLRNVQLKHS